uniref:ATP synthase F0 subunit a n=2 Tax=Conidiobolus TaxID=34487 RepID=UPI001D0FC1A7|nr:ATP synthase F0 subunit a [Conidiobolus polyspermus]QZZ81371.1 ATP synthase F0 subunit a [Conidiobolus polyspermus]
MIKEEREKKREWEEKKEKRKKKMLRNPLEQFIITDLISTSLPILSINKISITNLGLYLIIGLVLVTLLSQLVTNITSIVGNKSYLIKESLYDTINKIVRDQIGSANEIYLPYLYSIFVLILISNLVGMVPYSFTPTSHLALTLSLSVSILIGVTIIGLVKHKLVFFSLLVPAGTPLGLVPLLVIIESISYLARAVSLGVRLGANIIAGHTLLKILSTFLYQFMKGSVLSAIIGLLPMLIFSLLVGLELGIAFLQAIVFVILASSYIKDAIYLH